MDNFILANCTDTGRVRSVNEDSMTAFNSPNGEVVVVCDGMGGQNAGDVASQLAVTVIKDILTDNRFNTPEEAITSSVMAANQAILRRAAQNPGLSGMGSTCVMIIIRDGKVYYGSVGDSRIYYVSNYNIRQITKDQSYVQTLVDAGEITQEAAEHHRDKNQITNALGIEGMTPPVLGQVPLQPEPDSVFVLCSDGLSGMVSNNDILNIVSQKDTPLQDRAQMLVDAANAAGGNDNITVQLVEFPSGPSAAMYGSPVSHGGARGGGGQPAPKPKTNILPIVACAVAALILVGGGVYWFFGRSESKPASKQETNTVQLPSSTQAESSQPAAQPQPSQSGGERTVVIRESGGGSAPSAKAPSAKESKNSSKKSDKVKETITNNSKPRQNPKGPNGTIQRKVKQNDDDGGEKPKIKSNEKSKMNSRDLSKDKD